MGYNDYYSARDTVVEMMKKDWLGPVLEDEILCDERPLDYYIVGKLYPQESIIEDGKRAPSEDCGELDEEEGICLTSGRNPSSFGLSFSINTHVTSITIHISAAKYILINMDDAQKQIGFQDGTYKKTAQFWKRQPLDISDITIDIEKLSLLKTYTVNIDNGILVKIILHKTYPDGTKTISVTMINNQKTSDNYSEDCVNAVFQPEIAITSTIANAFRSVRRNVRIAEGAENAELAELAMLYSKFTDYASGHGCAVNWIMDDNGNAIKLYTEFLPSYELLQMMPTQKFTHPVLQMKYLAEAPSAKILDGLNLLLNQYRQWIEAKENDIVKLEPHHHKSGKDNILKCKETLQTLERSIEELKQPDVYRAFKLANKAMFDQRKMMLLTTGKFISDERISWYPFQLAFFLQEIISFADELSPERKKVDLLWFPTGGGKTEAYLGIAAFVIFLRRIRCNEAGAGVSVLMRYTLRLLSFQQFERAAALICACELIRKEVQIPGGEIGIGLWAGMALTPNKISKADKILRGERDDDSPSSNPAQFEKCPWCGAPIAKENYHCDLKQKRMLITCSNTDCKFINGLPVYLIDEEIYEHTPTFIVSTVDKFAQIALNQNTASLFGHVNRYIPPELIIQDELHLISGPLGTITGLYEAAICKLCERNGVMPKIVASTATIRNASEQIHGLYGAAHTQFPPQGLSIDDSFFAEQSSRNDRPARFYIGCMGVGVSPTTMMIRVMASLLYATRYLVEQGYDEKVIDSFWTQTGYFNTLRELGGAIIRVVDDIQDRLEYLRSGKFQDIYPLKLEQKRFDRYKELTSREKSENIGNVIQKELKEPYTIDGNTNPYDFLLASNMISVGVDVARLGTMVVVGQPKTTSEYIQATSRVGRETPGLIVATYNQTKSRDLSHYEDFIQYHNMFYRFVESTSVTPFSDRARDRALHTLYVILCRNMIPELFENRDAVNYKRDIPKLQIVRDYIYSYVERVDPEELDRVKTEIEDIEITWEQRASRANQLNYRQTKFSRASETLFQPDYIEDNRFRVLNSMRSVETTVTLLVEER